MHIFITLAKICTNCAQLNGTDIISNNDIYININIYIDAAIGTRYIYYVRLADKLPLNIIHLSFPSVHSINTFFTCIHVVFYSIITSIL